jgi:tetratricopeptide (TPR) repeat protein
MRRITPWLALALVVLGVLGPVIGNEFLDYDDAINITANPLVTHASLEGLLGLWQKPYINLYIPLTYTLWAILAKASSLLPGGVAGQPNAALFHAASLLLHLASAALVLRILTDICRSPWAAWAGACLFAIHPAQVEAVAWATGMKDLLSGLFALTALWLYLRFCLAARDGGGGRWGLIAASAVAFLLAMLAKPGAVAMPVVAWLMAVLLLDRRPMATAMTLLPWLLLAAPVVVVTSAAQAEPHHVFEPAWWQRFLVVGDAISFYGGKLMLPITLGPDYGRTPQWVLNHGWSLLSGTLPYGLLAALLWKGARQGRAAVGIFVSILLPVSGIIPFVFQQISTVADRYLYLAMLGPALALAWWLAAVKNRAVWWGVLLVLAVCGGKSGQQLRYWHEPKVFYDHALQVNPRSWTAYNNLGNWYADANRPAEAIAFYDRAITIDPQYAEAYNNLGTARAAMKQWQPAIDAFLRAMEINPYYVDAAINLGDAYRAIQLNEEAIGAYQFAIAAGTSAIKPFYSLCTLYQELKRNEEAASCYNKLLAIKPDSAASLNNLGTVYKELNRDAEAIAAYQQALALRPDFAEVYNNMGFVYAAQNKFTEAIPWYLKAAELYPGHALPMRNLALAYSALGQTAEAIRWLKKAIVVEPAFAPNYNELSRLHLALKEYPQAVEYGVRARELGLLDVELWQALTPHMNQQP